MRFAADGKLHAGYRSPVHQQHVVGAQAVVRGEEQTFRRIRVDAENELRIGQRGVILAGLRVLSADEQREGRFGGFAFFRALRGIFRRHRQLRRRQAVGGQRRFVRAVIDAVGQRKGGDFIQQRVHPVGVGGLRRAVHADMEPVIRIRIRHAGAVGEIVLFHICVRPRDHQARRAVKRGNFRRIEQLRAAIRRKAVERGSDGVNRLVLAEAQIILARDFVERAHGIIERIARAELHGDRLLRRVQAVIGRIRAAGHAVRGLEGRDVFRDFFGQILPQREPFDSVKPPFAPVLAGNGKRFAFMLPGDGRNFVGRNFGHGEAAARFDRGFFLRDAADDRISGAEYGQRRQQAKQPAASAHALVFAHFRFLLMTITMPAATSAAGITPTTSADRSDAVCCGITSASTSSDLARMEMLSSCSQA